MVTRGGTNSFSGRAYSYFRDDRFNARGHFLPDGDPKPDERTLQAGFALGGPIVRNRAHFYFTIERDNEDIAGQKLFPIDAQGWEADWDQLFNVAYTSVLTDRASNVVRVGRIGEQLGTGAQTYFNDDDVSFRGFDGRDAFKIGQRNTHPDYITGKGGTGANTRIRTYLIEESFSYFVPSLWGHEHTLK